uniref:Class II aldolase/adducin N-terminal domain-containing protein n=1 Tax=Amphora coffeiformis TaxID=265554 RepID=A0A7S3L772_9STRA|eukprot:scaffold2205_cov167-Amphora_coffeaeformis.AAC.10
MTSPTTDPICVSDTFHFSHYYWRSWDLSEAANADDSSGEETEVYKPKEVKSDDIKLKFYSQVMDDGSNNIHFGKWDGIPVDAPDAYGLAAEQATDYLWDLAMRLLPHREQAKDFRYVDLGSGTGASAIRIVQRHDQVQEATCLNLCHEQNIEAAKLAKQRYLTDRISVVDGTYEDAPFPAHSFDLAFSQDAFIHARSKGQTYTEAFRITKPGGAFVFSDLMAGENPDLSEAESQKFRESNSLNDFLDPVDNKKALEAAGWKEVHFIDLTSDMRISFQLMLKKVNFVLEYGSEYGTAGSNMNRVLLRKYSQKIKDRLMQIDKGIFKWCVFHCRKPVVLDLMCKPPVPFVNTSSLIIEDDHLKDLSSVAVIDIVTKMPREKIEKLPKTVELLITMSAGLDHIDMKACKDHGIQVMQSGRDAITSHVVQYVLSFVIIGLRDALSQLGVPFPKSGWNLNWNCEGKPLTDSKIAIIGMGVIGQELVRQIRALAPDTTIMYHVPECFRDVDAEGKYHLHYYGSLATMAKECDILVPMCPLTKATEHLVNDEILACLRPDAGLINMARGKVVDTEALTRALEKKQFKYAILDTTFPEPLPDGHALWKIENCFIFPHYATNTMAVRKALVEEIQPLVEEHFGLGHSDEKLRQQEQRIRHDLAVAHRLTANYNMDMLVWNHISAKFKTGCLITPGRMLWSQVKPEDLVFSSSNVTADIIHAAIYAARPDIGAIIHLHTPAATAVSCLETGFVPMTQDAAYFYNKVAHYEWDGVSDDAGEGPAITAAVRAMPGCNTLLMHNHGYVCFGKTVREAWVLAYYFERVCEVQLRVMQTGGKVKMPSPRVMAAAAESSYLPEFAPGACEWDALCNSVDFST